MKLTLDVFHSIDLTSKYTGITYWPKPYISMTYCETQNGFICQRPAAAGSASDLNGNVESFKIMTNISDSFLYINNRFWKTKN